MKVSRGTWPSRAQRPRLPLPPIPRCRVPRTGGSLRFDLSLGRWLLLLPPHRSAIILMRYPNLITAHAGEQPGTAPLTGTGDGAKAGWWPAPQRRTACAPRRELAYSAEGDGETAQPQQRRRLGGVVGVVCVLLRSSSEPMNQMYTRAGITRGTGKVINRPVCVCERLRSVL